jgi:hypothetical protein
MQVGRPVAIFYPFGHPTPFAYAGGKYLSFGEEPFDPSVSDKKYKFSRVKQIYSIAIKDVQMGDAGLYICNNKLVVSLVVIAEPICK